MTRSGTTAQRLYPPPVAEVPVENLYLDLELPSSATTDPGLPYVAINMVSSLDGKVSIDGRANAIGGAPDRRVMRNLRARCDAVLRGAGTLRAERISAGVPDDLARQRRALGLPEQPLEVILTATGNLPIRANLLGAAPGTTMVLAPEAMVENGSLTALRADAIVIGAPVASHGSADLRRTLVLLKNEHGLHRILVEGGPTLNHDLISASLVEDLFVTIAPKLLGGQPPGSLPMTIGEPFSNTPHLAKLDSVHLVAGELFLRYKLR